MKLECYGLRRRRRTVWIGLVIVAVLTLSRLGGIFWTGGSSSPIVDNRNKDRMVTTTNKKKKQNKQSNVVEYQDENEDADFLPPIQDMAELFHSSGRQQAVPKPSKQGNPAPSPGAANSKAKTPAKGPKKVSPLTTSSTPAAAATATSTATSTSSRPTAAPLLSLPPVPIVQPPPSFNFETVHASDGCTNATQLPAKIKAQMSNKFPPQISMDNLMEIVQAGMNPGSFRDDNSDTPDRRIAMCKLRREGNYAHFPHMMQQLTRCFSFWQIYPTYESYLYMYTHVHRNKNEDFNDGMLDILQNVFHVKVVYNLNDVDESTLLVKPLYDTGMEQSLQQGIVFQTKEHAAVFRRGVQAHYNISAEGCRVGKTEPIIAILNRQTASRRTIVNVKRLQQYLQKLTTHPVSIVTFENKTFLEQITFMSQTDILVSPHGAQLTSINFMPAPCGAVFEIFPPGYYVPHFFGPLAVTSGLRHGFVYTGQDVEKEWFHGTLHDKPARFRARRSNVCVPLQTSLQMIGKMVDKWKVCCQEHGIAMNFG